MNNEYFIVFVSSWNDRVFHFGCKGTKKISHTQAYARFFYQKSKPNVAVSLFLRWNFETLILS